ncbi:MAG: YicC family protein [Chitinophagales bacterium]|nr:YicC family protein [Chitinophagales bacterium]
MIYSMTGFGKSQTTTSNRTITIEIKTLNSKQFDVFLKLPSFIKSKEIDLRTIFQQELIKGKIEVFVGAELVGNSQNNNINKPVFESYYRELKSLANELGETNANIFAEALKNPEVLLRKEDEISDQDWKLISDAVFKTIHQVNDFRKQEGIILATELKLRIELIRAQMAAIEKVDALRLDTKREKIKARLDEVLGMDNFDPNRLELEMVFYMEKFDITEELVRLRAHLDLFVNTMDDKGIDNGRKLNFIAQEIGREINTIGSKANDKDMQHAVVLAKDELEKIKEQINNVL